MTTKRSSSASWPGSTPRNTAPRDFQWRGPVPCGTAYHRAQIRAAFGYREATRADEQRLAEWLAEEVCSVELREERQRRDALLSRCRQERLERPGRIGRLIASAARLADDLFCRRTVARLPQAAVERLEELIAEREIEREDAVWRWAPAVRGAALRSRPGGS